jgi:putative transposase
MPPGQRLDVEGGVYHVMARGLERRAIFCDDTDRQNCLRRLEAVAEEEEEEEDLAVLAYVLMDNQFRGSGPRARVGH